MPDYSSEHVKIGVGFKIKADPDAPAVPVKPQAPKPVQLKSGETLVSFGLAPGRMKRKDVPARPKEALRLPLSTSDRVFQHGRLRWRYIGRRLIRFIEYHPDGERSNHPYAREWHTRRPK